MTRDERIRAEEARAKAALPHVTFAFRSMDPDVCRVIVDHTLFICAKFPKIKARLAAIEAGGEELEWADEANIAWTSNRTHASRIVFREAYWVGDNDKAAGTACHEFGHVAAAEIDETPEGKAARLRLTTARGWDWERWADAAGAFFQRRPLPREGVLAKLMWKYCR